MKLDPNISIEVDEGVYAPSDDSFLLIESIQIKEGERVLEVGTGTGIVALHCAKVGALVVASDISEKAVENAKKNAEANGLSLNVMKGNLFEGVSGPFDVIIFNPPYLSGDGCNGLGREDASQLIGGESGAELSVRFLKEAKDVLADDGRIYLLTSSESRDEVLAHAGITYAIELAGQKRLFFETLEVYESKRIR